MHDSTETENQNENMESEEVQRDVSNELPDWLQEFREILVDESTSEKRRGDLMQRSAHTSSSSHDSPMEPRAHVEQSPTCRTVQDLATQWLQSFPCKRKSSEETSKTCCSSWSLRGNQKVKNTDNSLEFGRSCEELSWESPHHTDQKQMGLLREQCAESRKGHLRCYCSRV